MFARTSRLTLRPPWAEDAAALAPAIAHEAVVRMLARVPWPYALADAEGFVARARGGEEPVFLIFAHDGAATPRLVGGIGLHPEEGGVQLGYWLTPDAWGRGYATEAGRAVVAMARHALPVARLHAWHFTDNPASGRVLRKLGFASTGVVAPRYSTGRGGEADALFLELDLAAEAMPLAA